MLGQLAPSSADVPSHARLECKYRLVNATTVAASKLLHKLDHSTHTKNAEQTCAKHPQVHIDLLYLTLDACRLLDCAGPAMTSTVLTGQCLSPGVGYSSIKGDGT